MLGPYLSRRLRGCQLWLEQPEAAGNPLFADHLQEKIAYLRDIQEEIRLMRKLGSKPMIDLLKAECRITFSSLEIAVGANYREGASDNVIQVFNDRGLLQCREAFSKEGFNQAFARVEAAIKAWIEKEYPRARTK